MAKTIVKGAGILGAAALAAAALSSPAHAATTVVDWSSGTAYSGAAQASLLSPLTVSAGIAGTTTCTSVVLSGTVASAGALSMTGASIGGCSGIASGITPQNLPWAGSVTYGGAAPATGTISLSGFSIRATVLGVNCTYGIAGTMSAPGYNPDNASRPNPAAQAQVDLTGKVLPKTAGSFLCPGNATITSGVFALNGDAGGGSMTRVLGVTP
ncbi:hypothetical protein [Actinocorallia sp. A-T 12471]|uniref:hypothetical protein n=1 Tax=Actinocorallia sp. A-T 12471 TaxID=3089813 RepID=UPI0029CBF239|nr:hypothetical protein [Actinocorallia sp. A-T 12471]MDX6744926.1 hypothetical protein [Actinocorallia sp. A-T 12471]